jgi:hypothetical protein
MTEDKKMKFGKTILWINCWLFVVFGLGFMFVPETLATIITGAAPATPSGMTDMRATYGGMALGLAFIFGLCARSEASVRLGTQGVLAVMASLAVARVIGIIVDGEPNLFIWLLLFAEAVMAVVAFLALRKMVVD